MYMKVVEKDKVISGMLQDELKRCEEMLDSLRKTTSGLPRGVLSTRKKRYKKKVYSYHYLKYREGENVVNKHVPADKVQELAEKLEQRKKYMKEIKSYENKIAYLKRMLKSGRKRGHGNRSQK
jgi:hypothetical protein